MNFKEVAAVVFGIGYLLMPLDVIPDPIPVLGQADDLAVIAWVINNVRKPDNAAKNYS